MITTTTLLLALSGALIAAGVAVIVRDVRDKQRARSRLSAPHPDMHEAAVEVEAAHPSSASYSHDIRAYASPAGPIASFTQSAGLADALRAAGPIGEDESLALFQSLDASLASALRAVNGAFAQVDARLGPGGRPVWDAEEACHVVELPIVFGNILIGLLCLSRYPDELEISSIATDRSAGELSRTRRLVPHQLNVQAMAEAIAACAWPAIARHKDRPRRP